MKTNRCPRGERPKRECSSVGRARPSQGRGRGFEPHYSLKLNNMIKIRKSVFMELKGWTIYIKDEDGVLEHLISIPPTHNDRVDVYIQNTLNILHHEHKYLYDFKGNYKRLKGERIVIKIKQGEPEIEYRA